MRVCDWCDKREGVSVISVTLAQDSGKAALFDGELCQEHREKLAKLLADIMEKASKDKP